MTVKGTPIADISKFDFDSYVIGAAAVAARINFSHRADR
jgi:hypothetical protein